MVQAPERGIQRPLRGERADVQLVNDLTADRPATPIAVLAAYYRSVDAQRVSTTVDMEAPAQRVRRKVADEAARRPRP